MNLFIGFSLLLLNGPLGNENELKYTFIIISLFRSQGIG